ncbi:MAG: aldehyde ferredoxin oxidoreductase family protein [Nitrososphaerota archaeon]|nr:aldehyde ferredoxin oxidoreductase family protein [Nitrososphaerota archaeon]
MKSYRGKILKVDLSKLVVKDEILDEELLRGYLGGDGVATRLLYDYVPPNVKPFDANNTLIFMTGTLTGVVGARYEVVSKSPLTNGFGYANSGGSFGPELKRAGYDGIVIQGKAQEPVYLLIYDGAAELRDASHLWGKDTFETEDIIRQDFGDKRIKVACIGVAGERLVKVASVINDRGRAAARCGLGAVMGSKKLKAIAVRGDKPIPIHDEERVRKIQRDAVKKILEKPFAKLLSKYGTAGLFMLRKEVGYGIVKNWTRDLSELPNHERLSGESITSTILKSRYTCYMCAVGCGRIVEITSGPYAGMVGHGPEYETLASLGSQCCITDLETVAKANEMCNRYGMDTISVGGIIAFAMECYEKGLLEKKDVEGIELCWGNGEAALELIKLIGERKGIGDILAEGVKRAAERLGGRATEFTMHVKGLEVAMHDPRAYYGWALGYATATTGGRHSEGHPPLINIPEIGIKAIDRHSWQGLAEMIINSQNAICVINSIGLCYFVELMNAQVAHIPELLSAATGWEGLEWKGLLKIGERIFNLKRAFNIRHGISKVEDTLPKRFLREPLMVGASKGIIVNESELNKTIEEYYRLRGWDPQTGVPTKEKLNELNLQEVVNDLYAPS